MSNSSRSAEGSDDGAHLDEVPDGAGCFEVWSHLSRVRAREE